MTFFGRFRRKDEGKCQPLLLPRVAIQNVTNRLDMTVWVVYLWTGLTWLGIYANAGRCCDDTKTDGRSTFPGFRARM